MSLRFGDVTADTRAGDRRAGRSRPRRHRRRSGSERTQLAFVGAGKVVATLLSAVLLVGSGWGWYNFSQLNRNAHVLGVQGLGGPSAPSGPSASAAAQTSVTGTAQNILIVGTDSRAGLSPAQRRRLKVGNDASTSTDTIMLVHVPADGSKATLISIPRDSWVHIPGHPDAKINAAYADGYYYTNAKDADQAQTNGASTLVATVKQLTGVTIDHYVQVGFGGFVDIVRAIGTIPVDLCKSVDDTHAHNVAHGETGGSGFHMSAGHHDLTPQQALEFVRQRHNIPGPITDDLGRELRQRYFLSAAFKRILSAGVLLNPFRLRSLIRAVDGAFTFDNNNFDLTKFAEQMTNLSAGNIVGRSIPTEGAYTVDGQSALRVNPAAVRRVVQRAFTSAPAAGRSAGGSRSPGAGSSSTSPASPGGKHSTSGSAGLTSPAKLSCVY
jgi:LCP family protein required for cell wall assembly